MFCSHQWLGWHHPDPNFEQLGVLQSVLRKIGSGTIKQIDPLGSDVLLFPGLKGIDMSSLRSFIKNGTSLVLWPACTGGGAAWAPVVFSFDLLSTNLSDRELNSSAKRTRLSLARLVLRATARPKQRRSRH